MEKPLYTGGHEQAHLYQNQQILNHVQAIDMGIQQNNFTLHEYADAVNKKLQDLEKSKKRNLENVFITTQGSGGIFLLSSYDNGDIEGEPLTSSVVGNWEIYRLKFTKTEQKKAKFAIVFPINNVYVIGDLNKNSKSGLYDYFIKAQIVFNPQIDDKKIKKALYATFAPLIENCENTMEIPELAGWYGDKFVHSTNFPFAQRNGFPNLPVLDKKFPNPPESKILSREYFQLIRKIRRWQDRVILMELPIIGMLASLFAREGLKIPFFINFVFCENVGYDILPRFVQIFNRDTVQVIRADANEKSLSRELSQINDEILILDAFKHNQGSYRSKKIENNCRKIISKIIDNSSAYGIQRRIHTTLMVLSDHAIYGGRTLNIFIKKTFFKDTDEIEDLLHKKVVEDFIGKFIIYAQNNFEAIKNIINDHKKDMSDARVKVLETGFEILQRFCDSEGYNVTAERMLPSKIDFITFFDELLDLDDAIELFIGIVRKQMSNFLIYEKHDPNAKNIYACFYNDEHLWIPPVTLDIMLHNSGYALEKSAILSELKISGNLKTDTEGLTRKLQVNGKRQEFYQFKKEFFNVIGMADITNLGKEEI